MAAPVSKGIDLFKLESPFYLEGSPVIVSSGTLVMDRFTEETTIKLKIRNISDLKLVSCEVRIALFDARGNRYEHDLYYKYDGQNVARNKEFGTKNSISLPDNLVRSFDVMVCEVTFGDYTRWENEESFVPIDPMQSLTVAFDSEEMAKQYAVRYGNDCEYMPGATADLWYCACGAVNRDTETKCYACRRNRDALENVNFGSLKKDSEARIKSEKVAEDAARKAQEKKKKRSSLILKISLIVLPVLLVVALIMATVPPFIERRENYAAAEKLLDEQKFDAAEAMFLALGNYSDSADRAAKDVPYGRAMYVLDCAKNRDHTALVMLGLTETDVEGNDIGMFLYGKAFEMFSALSGYKESDEKLNEINAAVEAYNEGQRMNAYNAAAELLEKGVWLSARDAFLAMDGYKDSTDRATECMYTRAAKLADFCLNNNVRRIYMNISSTVGEKTYISMPGTTLNNLGSDVVSNLKEIFDRDGVEVLYEDSPSRDAQPICDAVRAELDSFGGYRDTADLSAAVAAASDFTAEFYTLLRNGELQQAAEWLRMYDDDVPERGQVTGWIETYAPFTGDWGLYKGDTTVVPRAVGITEGNGPHRFTTRISVENGKAILHITPEDADYEVLLYADAGETNFSSCPDGTNYYYGRINQVDHFIFMWYLENGTMASSCEYMKV